MNIHEGRIYANESFVIPYNSGKIISVDFENKRRVENGLYFISYNGDNSTAIPDNITNCENGRADLFICNLSEVDQTVDASTDLGYYERVTEADIYET